MNALYNTDQQLWENYRAHCLDDLPNGGAALQITEDGTVANGYQALARFASKRDAETTLKAAGFHKIWYGWKANPAVTV